MSKKSKSRRVSRADNEMVEVLASVRAELDIFESRFQNIFACGAAIDALCAEDVFGEVYRETLYSDWHACRNAISSLDNFMKRRGLFRGKKKAKVGLTVRKASG